MANEVAKQGISTFLNTPAVRENIEGVVGKDVAQSFVSDVVACVQNNPSLAVCTNKSILSGALVAKSINLPLTPQLGYAYLVPFKNKKKINGQVAYVDEAQIQVGYKGYVQLALRSGQYRKLVATDVRKNEVVNYDAFNDEYALKCIDFEKRMERDNKGNYVIPIIGYYAKFELTNGFVKELFMSAQDMESYAKKYSKAYRGDIDKHTSYSFWTTRFEDMAKKTMLRQLLGKWGLLTPELEKAYTYDMSVVNESGEPEYVDNAPDIGEPTIDPLADIEDAEFREIESDMPDFLKDGE